MRLPNLPEMTVEKREPKSAHRVPEPDLSPQNMSEQIQDAIQLNEDAKLYKVRELLYREVDKNLEPLAWPKTTTDILIKYISQYVPDVTREEIIEVSKNVIGCNGIDQVARWVQDDMCSEFFNRTLRYCLKEQQKHKRDKDFIDGSGIGYLQLYTHNLKSNIEKAFDAKYFYKVIRPLEWIWLKYGMDLTKVANKINPGHFSFGQGHSCKSFTAVETLNETFHLDNLCYRAIFIAACVFGHGRDANLIHYPMDTYASGYTTTLKEFK